MYIVCIYIYGEQEYVRRLLLIGLEQIPLMPLGSLHALQF